jgi:flagellar export protein FliJ
VKRFRFPLKPVALLRAHREAQAREAFAAAVRASAQAEAALAAVRQGIAEFEAAIEAGRRERFSAAAEARALAAYRRERLNEAEAGRALDAARTVVQQRRADYLEARRRVEVVERLEDQARARHRAEGAREEQAGFDELAVRRFAGGAAPFSS